MEDPLTNEFGQIMLYTSKPLEKLLVSWISQYSDQPVGITSFDILHESIEVVYEACEKVGMNLFLPEDFLSANQSLENLVDAIKEFWKRIKGKNIFEVGRKFFQELVAEDFVFEEHINSYILDYKEVEFGFMLFLLLTFFMVRKRGNQSVLEESKIFNESEEGEDFIRTVLLLFENLDNSWEDVKISDSEVRRGTVVGGDIGLLKKIEAMKEEIGQLTTQNLEYNKKVEDVDRLLAEKDDDIDTLKKEKSDIQLSKDELLKTIEGMKQEWLEEGLKEKQEVGLLTPGDRAARRRDQPESRRVRGGTPRFERAAGVQEAGKPKVIGRAAEVEHRLLEHRVQRGHDRGQELAV